MKPPAPSDLVIVGAIAGAFGVRGEVRVRSFTTAPEGVVAYGTLYDASGAVALTPVRWRPIKDGLAVTAREVTSREAAEALRNTALHVPRHVLPPPDDDEFYHVDLIGCRVEALDGAPLGAVVAVHDFGAGDLLAVRDATGRTMFLPFTLEAVPVVDVKARRIVATPPVAAAEDGDDADSEETDPEE